MSGRLNGRVSRLENGRPRACPECGWDGDWSNVQIEVEWEDLDGDAGPKEESPQFCPECGHQWEYVIAWIDLPNEGEEKQS